MAVVLDEVVDEEYEPTQQEILEYGEWLGMDVDQDKELLWIAREGLKAPLPKSWKPCQSSDGDIFYFNFETGDSVWDHPCDDHFRRLYRRAKARRDAPQRLVSISGSMNEARQLTVTCIGSLNGFEIATLVFKPSGKVKSLRSALAKQLEITKRCIRFLLPDGRVLTDADDRSSLARVLGFVSAFDEEEVRRKEKEDKDKSVEGKREERKGKHPKSSKATGKSTSDQPRILQTTEYDQDYEPCDAEVKKYAEWLGMDLEKDADLLWIAREGLKAPLPHNWKPCKTSTGEIFYYNTDTCTSFWDHPCDDHYRRLLKEVRERQTLLRSCAREAASDPLASDPKSLAVTILNSTPLDCSKLNTGHPESEAESESFASKSSSSSSSFSTDTSCSRSSSVALLHVEASRQRTPKLLPPLDLRPSSATLDEAVAIS